MNLVTYNYGNEMAKNIAHTVSWGKIFSTRGERGKRRGKKKRNTTIDPSFFASVTRTGVNPKGIIFIGVRKPNQPHCIDAIAYATLATGHFFSIPSFQILFSILKAP